MLWLKWHSLNFSLKFLSLSHRIEKKAANDVESANNDTSKRIKYQNGAGLNYENEVASKYYDFWGRDFNPKRMDTYVLILFIEVIGVVFINTLFPDFFSLLKYFEFIAITVFCLIVMELIVEYSKKNRSNIIINDDTYNSMKRWMHSVGDESRHPYPPLWALIIIGVGLLLEGFAISVIVISLIGDFSKSQSQYLGFIMGLVITGVMAWLVHKAGETIYKEKHRQALRSTIIEEGGIDKIDPSKNAYNEDEQVYKSKTYDILKKYVPVFSVDNKVSSWPVWFAIIVVLSVSGLAYFARAEFNKDLIKLQASLSSTPTNSLLPPEISAIQNQNQSNQLKEEVVTNTTGMYLGLALLTLIFILVNYFGAHAGYSYCFYHDRSKECNKAMSDYNKAVSERKKISELKEQVDGYMSAANKRVIRKANQFFEKYQQVVAEKAAVYNDFSKILNKRGAFDMIYYINNRHDEDKKSTT